MKNLIYTAVVTLFAASAAHVNASDCDGNGISDSDEIASGRAYDSDSDGTPDSCEGLATGPVLRSMAINMGPATCGWWTTANCGAWFAWVSRDTDTGPWVNGSSAAGNNQKLDIQLVAGRQTIYVRHDSNGCGSDFWGLGLWFELSAEPQIAVSPGSPCVAYDGPVPSPVQCGVLQSGNGAQSAVIGSWTVSVLSYSVADSGYVVGPGELQGGGSVDHVTTIVVEVTPNLDADCNSDGIVDYGQCHDGTLPDYNSNNIPDCCERGEVCVVGNYPVQWRVEDGGNGHWYRRVNPNSNLTWTQAETVCELIGAHLATVPAASESAFVHLIVGQSEVYLGGLQPANSCEPSCEWQWLTGEPWSYTNWNPGEPNNSYAEQNFLRTYPNGSWDDVQDGYAFPFAIAAEWSADCNNDNIVDYGQILQGQIADTNTNGIPDICEGPTCHDIDLNLNGIVDGGDLGILLAFWGTVSPAFPRADINGDGLVNGADLGIMLSFWGACP